MKNTYKSFALLCMGLAAVACVEENFQPESGKIDTTPGNEIVFTASAGIEDGFKSDSKTKTVYGDKDETNKKIEINWVSEDKISIVSPQAAGAAVGHYQVVPNSHTDGKYEGAHGASSLTRLGDAGLQWTAEEDYAFYAVYPSVLNSTTASLTKDGVFTGVLPKEQTFKGDLVPSGASGYIATPNMDYAFMTASSSYSRIKDNGAQNTEAIDLGFNSLVTALQFDITAGSLTDVYDKVTGTTASSYDIISVALTSKTKNISGNFEYNFQAEEDAYKSTNSGGLLSNQVVMYFNDPVKLVAEGGFLDLTFFILPEKIVKGDLELKVLFKLGSTQMSLTATINQELQPGKKYVFSDVRLKDFTNNINAGSWFDTVEPSVNMSQLSIPVASNVFAISGNGFAEKSLQQVLDYEALWALGVRGFELVNRRTVTISGSGNNKKYSVDNDSSLAGAHFVCDEVPLEPTTNKPDVVTFGDAFETLAGKLQANPKEFLAVFCTYQAIGDGYDPDGYVKQLLNYLDNFVAKNGYFKKEHFIQMTSSTTVQDAQGKICIIIRPGDDARYETNNYTSGISLSSSGGEDWSGNVTLIEDWGTAFDVWDRRYDGVARESTFETKYYHKTGLPQIEDWLWGVSEQEGEYKNYSGQHDFNAGKDWPEKRDKFYFDHAVKGPIGNAYVQEWARVSSGNINQSAKSGSVSTGIFSSKTVYLWVKWPESLEEKKDAIHDLFEASVDELNCQNNNLYINSLSGYLIDKKYVEGLYPFKETFKAGTSWIGLDDNFSVSNQGKGGDHKGLATILNQYTYDILSGTNTHGREPLKPGPWGYVMMEHIGQDQTSLDLVDLIMMNNFKLDLGTGGNGGSGDNGNTGGGGNTEGGEEGGEEEGGIPSSAWVGDYDSAYLDGENAISFE